MANFLSPATTLPNLLSLPRELRDQIWRLSFAHHHVSPHKSAFATQPQCATCQTLLEQPPEVVANTQSFRSLLVNKQVFNEARAIFHDSLTLHVSNVAALSTARTSGRRGLCAKVRHLTLYVHLDHESRHTWLPELLILGATFPGLQKLTVHNHMRAPISYERLVDAIYLLGPLITLPSHLKPSPIRAGFKLAGSGPTVASNDVEAGVEAGIEAGAEAVPGTLSTSDPTQTTHRATTPDTQADPDGMGTTDTSQSESQEQETPKSDEEVTTIRYKSEELNPNLIINFAYCVPEILFESPFLGTISTSDAIDEHEAVLRDCLADTEFRRVAEMRDLSGMTMILLTIAREHEQLWLEGLHRRHMGHDYDFAAAEMDAEPEDSDDENVIWAGELNTVRGDFGWTWGGDDDASELEFGGENV